MLMQSMTPRNVKAIGLLVLLLGVFAAFHLHVAQTIDTVRLSGDERVYVRASKEAADKGVTGLLPGTQEFAHRTRFNTRVFSLLYPAQGHADAKEEQASFLRNVSIFHVVVTAIILIALYFQGVWLKLGPFVSLIPPLLLALFPWFGFYIHTLWPEILHAGLLTVAFSLLVAYSKWPRLRLLIPAGVLIGYGLLTKGVLNQFVVILVPFVIISTFVQSRDRSKRQLATAALSGSVLLGSIAFVAAPQLYVNNGQGHGLRFSDNKWRNIEFGIRGVAPSDPPELRLSYPEARKQYWRGPRAVREVRAKQRTIAFLAEQPAATSMSRQMRKYWVFFTSRQPILERELQANRWPRNNATWVAHLITPARWMFSLMVVLGLLGTFLVARPGSYPSRNSRLGMDTRSGWLLLSLFSLYYFATLFVVSFNMRFVMQLIPTLSLLSVGGIAKSVRAFRR